MSKFFYPKLAADNLRKNSQTYTPYILTCILTIAMFYMIVSLAGNPGVGQVIYGNVVQEILMLGSWVTGIFAVIFLFYTNSFLLKRRKKEFGLYAVLGMEKKHLAKMILWETVYIAGISLSVGILTGILLDKLRFVLLLRLFDAAIPLGFHISGTAIGQACVLFLCIDLLIVLNSFRQVYFTNPAELLKGGQVGEKEPKTRWLMAIMGVLSLSAGYVIALYTQNPLLAVSMFFVAVILVIIGTYCLFIAGSVALLKLLRKNKKYYYKTQHFISVSGMLYRMKQNAVGLANICILSTMVLVMISSTLSLYLGLEDSLQKRFPREILVSAYGGTEEGAADTTDVRDLVSDVTSAYGLHPENAFFQRTLCCTTIRQGDSFRTEGVDEMHQDTAILIFIPLEDYNAMAPEPEQLEQGEILLYAPSQPFSSSTLQVFGDRWTVRRHLESFITHAVSEAYLADTYFIVVPDFAALEQLELKNQEAYENYASEIRYTYGFDLDTDPDTQEKICDDLLEIRKTSMPTLHLDTRTWAEANERSLFGGLFFLGVFLGGLFLLATILLIYYKQISEGYDDRQRFEIMQKVGLGKGEIRKSIHAQVLTVFFLPLITAGIHMAFAFPFIARMLALFDMTNILLFGICTLGSFLVFAGLYAAVYLITARSYYKIVS